MKTSQQEVRKYMTQKKIVIKYQKINSFPDWWLTPLHTSLQRTEESLPWETLEMKFEEGRLKSQQLAILPHCSEKLAHIFPHGWCPQQSSPGRADLETTRDILCISTQQFSSSTFISMPFLQPEGHSTPRSPVRCLLRQSWFIQGYAGSWAQEPTAFAVNLAKLSYIYFLSSIIPRNINSRKLYFPTQGFGSQSAIVTSCLALLPYERTYQKELCTCRVTECRD